MATKSLAIYCYTRTYQHSHGSFRGVEIELIHDNDKEDRTSFTMLDPDLVCASIRHFAKGG